MKTLRRRLTRLAAYHCAQQLGGGACAAALPILGILTITAAERLRFETFLIKKGGGFHEMRLARVGDIVLLDHPADATGPRSINVYLVKTLHFTAAAAGGADVMRFKIDPQRLLYSLRWKHNGTTVPFRLSVSSSARSKSLLPHRVFDEGFRSVWSAARRRAKSR